MRAWAQNIVERRPCAVMCAPTPAGAMHARAGASRLLRRERLESDGGVPVVNARWQPEHIVDGVLDGSLYLLLHIPPYRSLCATNCLVHGLTKRGRDVEGRGGSSSFSGGERDSRVPYRSWLHCSAADAVD